MSGETIRYRKCVCTTNCTDPTQFKCDPIELDAIPASAKEAVPAGTSRHYQKCVCKADCTKSDNFTCTTPDNIVSMATEATEKANNIAMQGKSGGIFNNINSMPAVTPLQYSSGTPPGIVKYTGIKPSGPRWKKVITLLENTTNTPIIFNPLTGELETTVQLRGTAETFGHKSVPLKLTGYSGIQLASSYYFSDPVQAFLGNLNARTKKREERNESLEKKKADLEKEIADDELLLEQLSNPKDPKAPKLKDADRNMIKARIAGQKLAYAEVLKQEKAAATARQAKEKGLLNNPTVSIAGSSDKKKGEELVKQIKENYYVENVKGIADLIDGGADLQFLNKDGNAAIHLACLRNAPLLVTKLLQMDPNLVTFKNSNGDTILHIAAEKNYKTIAEIVIDVIVKNKFSLDTVNTRGDTALHIAYTTKRPAIDVACALLRAGANYTLIGSAKKTAEQLGDPLDFIAGCLSAAKKKASSTSSKTRSRRAATRRAATRRRR